MLSKCQIVTRRLIRIQAVCMTLWSQIAGKQLIITATSDFCWHSTQHLQINLPTIHARQSQFKWSFKWKDQMFIQSKLSYAPFSWTFSKRSHMTGGCLMQCQFAYIKCFGQTEIWSHMTEGCLIQGVAKAVSTVLKRITSYGSVGCSAHVFFPQRHTVA